MEQTADGARYHLLATIRDYAQERLAEAADEEPVRRAHLRYFTGLAEEIGPLIERGEGRDGLERELDRLDAERPNLRAALDFASQSGSAEAALRLAGQLGRYVYLRGHYLEIRQWLDQAVADGQDAPAALRAKALLGSGRLALLQCDYGPAVRCLEAALRLYRELAVPQGIASALQALGSVAREQGRYARSAELHAEGLAIAAAAADRWAVASAHSFLGFVSWLQGDFGRATADCTAALAEFRALGDIQGTASSLLFLGTVARYEGDRHRAAALLEQSRSLAESIGFREGIAWSLEQLGLLTAAGGDPAAATLLRRSLALHRELRDRWRICSVLEDLAAVALAGGDVAGAQQAAGLLGAAEGLREAIGTVIAPCERAQHEETLSGARAALGAGTFTAAWQRGRLAHPDDLEVSLPIPAPGRRPPQGSRGLTPPRALPPPRTLPRAPRRPQAPRRPWLSPRHQRARLPRPHRWARLPQPHRRAAPPHRRAARRRWSSGPWARPRSGSATPP